MRAFQLRKFCLLVLLAGTVLPTLTLDAQQFKTVSAQGALEAVRVRFGMESVRWIAEVKGTGGQPQPIQWDIVAYDSASPGLLHHFRASSGLIQDGGPDSRRYPADIPNGFFNITDIGVDSVAAFTIAEAEARKAKLGFDSCDYFLQMREFTDETIWKLDLIDATHRLVGSVFISGSNGEVLRTVWIQRGSISGFPNIIDSFSPSPKSFTGISGGSPELIQQQPYSPGSPERIIRNIPSSSPGTPNPKRGSIFREFPIAGGGGSGSNPALPPSTNPLDPTPGTPGTPAIIKIPETEEMPIPINPLITEPAPPIKVNGNEGSSARIPPPPVPR